MSDALIHQGSVARWRRCINQVLAAEVSACVRYYDRLIQLAPRNNDALLLFEDVQCREKILCQTVQDLPRLTDEAEKRCAVLLNGNLNHDLDIQGLLSAVGARLVRTSRVIVVAYNPYLSWLYLLANHFGLRSGEAPLVFLTAANLRHLATLAGFEVIRVRPAAYCPWRFWGIGKLINKVMPLLPLVRWLGLAALVVLRPLVGERGRPSISIIIPARNEKGNVENAIKRLPDFPGAEREVIFVEGHSTDGTWAEIKRVEGEYGKRLKIASYRQAGEGKADAVRLGFGKASHELVAVLDADLTMPPEMLPRFYDAYCRGLGDFVNGNRMLYPMEDKAMRFLNRLGNVFFAKTLSFLLQASLGDSLCGTKLVARHDYLRMAAWREELGINDPFGDFELLFPAAEMALGIVEVPVRYLDRKYGRTNILRLRHGLMLLRIALIGLWKIRAGKT